MYAIDLTTFYAQLNTLVAPAAVALGAWVVSEANSLLKLNQKSAAQDNLDQAIQHGENLLQEWWISLEQHNKTANVPSGTLSDIAQKVIALAPGAEDLLGVTPESVGELLQARLTAWLHWHPTVLQAAAIAQVAPTAPAETGTTAAA